MGSLFHSVSGVLTKSTSSVLLTLFKPSPPSIYSTGNELTHNQKPSHFRHFFSTRFLHNAESIEPAVDQIPCRELNTRRWEQSAFQRLVVRVLRKVGLELFLEA